MLHFKNGWFRQSSSRLSASARAASSTPGISQVATTFAAIQWIFDVGRRSVEQPALAFLEGGIKRPWNLSSGKEHRNPRRDILRAFHPLHDLLSAHARQAAKRSLRELVASESDIEFLACHPFEFWWRFRQGAVSYRWLPMVAPSHSRI